MTKNFITKNTALFEHNNKLVRKELFLYSILPRIAPKIIIANKPNSIASKPIYSIGGIGSTKLLFVSGVAFNPTAKICLELI